MTTQIGQERAKTLTVKTDIDQLDCFQVYRQMLSIYKPTEQDPGRPPLPTEIEPKLKAHIDHWFKIYKSNDIPIKTPQMLYVFFQYPECNLLKILNAVKPDAYYESSSSKITRSKEAIDSDQHENSTSGKNYMEKVWHMLVKFPVNAVN